MSSQLQVPRTPIKDFDTNLAKNDLINQILTFRTINWVFVSNAFPNLIVINQVTRKIQK